MKFRRTHEGAITPWPSRYPRRFFAIALTLVLVGFFSLGQLSLEFFPRLNDTFIRIQVSAPGVPARIIEEKITRQLESALANTHRVAVIESVTRQGSVHIDLRLKHDDVAEPALHEIRAIVERARPLLLAEIAAPVVQRIEDVPDALDLVLTSTAHTPAALRDWAEAVFAKQFNELVGIAGVDVIGGMKREILIQPNQRRLAGLGLSSDDLITTLQNSSDSVSLSAAPRSAGYTSRRRDLTRLGNAAAVAALPVLLPDGEVIPLMEIVDIELVEVATLHHIRFNGEEGVKVLVRKQPQAGSDASYSVRARLDWMKVNGLIPSGVQVHTIANPSRDAQRPLRHIAWALVGGVLFTALAVYLASGHWRSALRVGAIQLVSLQAAVLLWLTLGMSVNLLTLGGAALGVGLMGLWVIFLQASAASRSTAALYAALIVVSLIPMTEWGGQLGKFFWPLCFTLSVTVVVSLLLIVMAPLGRGGPRSESAWRKVINRAMEQIQKSYCHWLRKAVAHAITTISVILVLSILVVISVSRITREPFLPPMTDGRVDIRLVFDPGMTSVAKDERLRQVENLIRAQGQVETQLLQPARAATSDSLVMNNIISVQLSPPLNRAQWIGEFQTAANKLRFTDVLIDAWPADLAGTQGMFDSHRLHLRLQGPDLAKLATLGDELLQRLKSVAGLHGLKHSAQVARNTWDIQVNQERAGELGIDVMDIARALEIATNGLVVGDFQDAERHFDIRLLVPAQIADTLADKILLRGELPDRPALYLSDVADVIQTSQPAEIRHRDRMPVVDITASLMGNASWDDVARQARQALATVTLPVGYRLDLGNASGFLGIGAGHGTMVFVLTLALVLAMLTLRFKSLPLASMAMLGTPMAWIGAAASLALCGFSLSLPAWFGACLLIGISAVYAADLLQSITSRRAHGDASRSAVIEAVTERFRPWLAMTLTATAGLMPLALGWGGDIEWLQTFAVVLIGGILFSFLAVILWLPVLYCVGTAD